MKKRLLALSLALALCFGLAVPAFAADSDFTIEDGVLTKYNGPGGDVVIPDGVTKIGDSAFGFPKEQQHVTSVTIPNSVTEIGEYAFAYCVDLTGAAIPDSVTGIGSDAFIGCSALTSVTLPNGIAKIESGTFSECAALTDISIPDGVTVIGYSAFYHCTGLTGIAIPGSAAKIDCFAFAGCTSLASAVISEGVTEICWNAFYGCTSLTSVSIPASVTEISDSAFEDTPWLEQQGEFPAVNGILLDYQGKGGDVVIPEGIVKVAPGACLGCKSLTGITISTGVTEIGYYAFGNCPGLTTVFIQEGVARIGANAFNGCPKLTDVTLPASVTEIGQYAFLCMEPAPAGYETNVWPPDGLVFHAPAGSYAETYARENGIPFAAVGSLLPFTDVPGWCSDAVIWAVEQGITNGTGNNKFSPEDKCKNTEILTFLWRAAGKPEAAPSPFTVASYFQDAVDWAYGQGFIDDTFVPSDPCTRASAVKFIWQAFGKEGAAASNFDDVPPSADYAAAVDWAVANGITNGTGGGAFSPDATCKRGEIVTFLHRAYVPEARLTAK